MVELTLEKEHKCAVIEVSSVNSISSYDYGKRWFWYHVEKPNTLKERTTAHEIQACPYCGEHLTEPAPLTIEQLSRMNGEPVYIVELGRLGVKRWRLLDNDTPVDYELQDVNVNDGDCYSTFDYGKTWTAYDRPPKGGLV